jgi:hypothetical protein
LIKTKSAKPNFLTTLLLALALELEPVQDKFEEQKRFQTCLKYVEENFTKN